MPEITLTHGDAILLVGSFWQVNGHKGFFRISSVKAHRKMVGSQLLVFSLDAVTGSGSTNATGAKLLTYCELRYQKDVYGPRVSWRYGMNLP